MQIDIWIKTVSVMRSPRIRRKNLSASLHLTVCYAALRSRPPKIILNSLKIQRLCPGQNEILEMDAVNSCIRHQHDFIFHPPFPAACRSTSSRGQIHEKTPSMANTEKTANTISTHVMLSVTANFGLLLQE